MKWILRGVVAAAFAGLVAFAGYETYLLGWWRMNYPSLERFPIQGVDVSHHQGKIDWSKVATDQRISFAYLKATEGGDHKDRRFAENWQALKDTRIARGAYHFFTFCKSGKEQAQNLLSVMPVEAGMLPAAIDLEFGGNCNRRPTLTELAKELDDFVTLLRAADDRAPVFYVTPEFNDAYMKGNAGTFPDHVLWLRDIYGEPAQAVCASWTFWQYAGQGLVDGVTGPVDLNAYCGDPTSFAALVRP